MSRSAAAKRGSSTTKTDEDKYADLLAPLLGRGGALDGPASVPTLVRDVLPHLPTVTSRQLACIVLQLSSPEVLHAFSASEGPELVADWLREALERAPAGAAEAAAAAADGAAAAALAPYSPSDAPRAEIMVLDALKAVRPMPVTRPMLKASRLPKAIGALHKRHPAEAVRRAAGGVMEAWKGALTGGGGGGGGGNGSGGGSAGAGSNGGAASGGRCVLWWTHSRGMVPMCLSLSCSEGDRFHPHPPFEKKIHRRRNTQGGHRGGGGAIGEKGERQLR
jgi:hypothetical protein